MSKRAACYDILKGTPLNMSLGCSLLHTLARPSLASAGLPLLFLAAEPQCFAANPPNSAAGLIIINAAGIIMACNKPALNMFGVSEGMMGRNVACRPTLLSGS